MLDCDVEPFLASVGILIIACSQYLTKAAYLRGKIWRCRFDFQPKQLCHYY